MFRPTRRSRIASAGRRLARRGAAFGVLILRTVPLVLVAAALWLFFAQSAPELAELDALIAIAGIVATVLSLGLTVTLLVAQHTAERHAQVLYVEFRRERSWTVLLAALGMGVVLIVTAALWRPTISTAWAALALAAALGAFAASLLPRLLDSLDRTILAMRIADRTVVELRNVGRRAASWERDPALKPVARRGVEISSVIADQGIATNDREVLKAGYAGMRRVLVAYVEGSTTRGWDGEVIGLAFQHLGVATERCAAQSPILLLPTAIEELTALGVESQATLERDGPETISIRLNSLFLRVVAMTLTNEESAAAAMATSGIGDSGMALIRADSPNGVADHIRRLRSIALAALGAGQDHVAGTAHLAFSKLARGLASLPPDDVMPSSLYDDICSALGDSVDAYVARGSRGLVGDVAWMWVTGPHFEHNLSHAIVAGVAAHSRRERRVRSEFGRGAVALSDALVRLSVQPGAGSLIQSYAAETAYLGVLGAMALDPDETSAEVVPELWLGVVRRLLDPTTEVSGEIDMLSALLLVGVYEAESPRPAAPSLREGLNEALRATEAIGDDFHRRRRARAWVAAGRAALGADDVGLAAAIAAAIARDVVELRRLTEGSGTWRVIDDEDWRSPLFTAGQAFYPRPEIPDDHRRSDVVETFDALLAKYDVSPARRRSGSQTGSKRGGQPRSNERGRGRG